MWVCSVHRELCTISTWHCTVARPAERACRRHQHRYTHGPTGTSLCYSITVAAPKTFLEVIFGNQLGGNKCIQRRLLPRRAGQNFKPLGVFCWHITRGKNFRQICFKKWGGGGGGRGCLALGCGDRDNIIRIFLEKGRRVIISICIVNQLENFQHGKKFQSDLVFPVWKFSSSNVNGFIENNGHTYST